MDSFEDMKKILIIILVFISISGFSQYVISGVDTLLVGTTTSSVTGRLIVMDGNVGIETTEPGATLDVSGNIHGDTLRIDSIWENTADHGVKIEGVRIYDSIINSVKAFQFTTGYADLPHQEAKIWWDDDNKTLTLDKEGGTGVRLQVGQEMHIKVYNNSGAQIDNGKACKVTGVQGNRPTMGLAQADTITNARVVGVATHDISNSSNGYITSFGLVRDINTTGTPEGEVWAAGDILYLNASIAGALTKNRPNADSISAFVGIVLNAHANEGIIFVNINFCLRMSFLSDVNARGAQTDKQLLHWVTASNYWDTVNVTDILGDGNLTENYVTKFDGVDLANSVIYDNGNVGINTTNPLAKLEVNGNIFQTTGDYLKTDKVRAIDADGLSLYDDGDLGIFVEDGGMVGMGTINPDAWLHIAHIGGSTAKFHRAADHAASPAFILMKSRGTTTSPTTILANDQLGSFQFRGYHATDWITGAKIEALGTHIDGDTLGSALLFYTRDTVKVIAERLRIDHFGNVGINSNSPTEKLEVVGSIKATTFKGNLEYTLTRGYGLTGSNFNNSAATTWKVDTSEIATQYDISGFGTGSVTSVGLSLPATEFGITGSPVTTSGTLTATWDNQTTNKVFSAPNGSTGTPTFRALVANDVPNHDALNGFVSQKHYYQKDIDTVNNALSGLAKLTSGVISAITDNSGTWNTALQMSDTVSTLATQYYVGSQGFITATLTKETVQDYAWDVLGGTQTLITVTYQDATNDVDFVVDEASINHNNLTNTHNLTTDIDHNQLTNYVATKHYYQKDIDTVNNALSGLAKLTSGVISAITDNSGNWNTAYGWGDHSGLYSPIADSSLWTLSGTHIYSKNSGNVGIGSATPGQKLDVNGIIQTNGLIITGLANSNEITALVIDGTTVKANPLGNNFAAISDSSLWTLSGTHIYSKNSGNVGIGSATPGQKLDVNGTVGINDYIYHNGDLDTYFYFSANRIRMAIGNNVLLENAGDTIYLGSGGYDTRLHDFFIGGVTNHGNIGIADDTPSYKLDLNGTLRVTGISQFDSNVGIGTTTPLGRLHVKNPASGSLELITMEAVYYTGNQKSITWRDGTNITGQIDTRYDGSIVNMVFGHLYNGGHQTTDLMIIKGDGKVGIGILTPQNKLDIEGAAVIGAAYSGTNTAPTNGLLVEGNIGIGSTSPVTTLDVQGGYATKVRIITATYPIDNSGEDCVIICRPTAATITITLPTASANTGRHLWIKNDISNTRDVIITGVTTLTDWQGVHLVSDGTNWIVIGITTGL